MKVLKRKTDETIPPQSCILFNGRSSGGPDTTRTTPWGKKPYSLDYERISHAVCSHIAKFNDSIHHKVGGKHVLCESFPSLVLVGIYPQVIHGVTDFITAPIHLLKLSRATAGIIFHTLRATRSVSDRVRVHRYSLISVCPQIRSHPKSNSQVNIEIVRLLKPYCSSNQHHQSQRSSRRSTTPFSVPSGDGGLDGQTVLLLSHS